MNNLQIDDTFHVLLLKIFHHLYNEEQHEGRLTIRRKEIDLIYPVFSYGVRGMLCFIKVTRSIFPSNKITENVLSIFFGRNLYLMSKI